MTNEREKEELIKGLKTINRSDTDVYFIEYKELKIVFGLVLYKPTYTLLSISYSSIWGYTTCSVVKPTREHGTGFLLVGGSNPQGAYMPNTAFNDVPKIAEMAERLLMRDIRIKHVFINEETVAMYKYKNLQEYIDKRAGKHSVITKLSD